MDKRCIKCGEVLPLSQFPTNRRMPDGHLGWCFDCFATRQRVIPERPVNAVTSRIMEIVDEDTQMVVKVEIYYDKDDRPICRKGSKSKAERKAYHRAYNQWHHRCTKNPTPEAVDVAEVIANVAYDAEGKPIRPPQEGRTAEAMRLYRNAYNRWYNAQRKANEPNYQERQNAWKRDWRAKMAERGELKIRTARYCRAWRERHPERYEEAKRRKREAYHEKKSQKVLDI